MQAMKVKSVERFSIKRIWIAAVALGTLTIGLVGTTALLDATWAGSDARPVAVTRSIAPIDQSARIRYLEWNSQLPSAVAPVRTAAEIAFLEMNELPQASPQRVDYADMHFAEINQLPEPSVAAPASRYDARFLEINQLPGDELVAPEIVRGGRS